MHYYGTRLSENISRREPEGYLLCLNVPVARSGTQEYLPSELGLPSGLGLITVYRPPEEVFAPAAIASFEGMPVTNDHPPDGVDAGNIRALQKGHAHNVRRGSGEESDLLLADLIITDPALISAILEEGKREISCGYTYELCSENGKYIQRQIRGNHVAVVDAGRAGSRVCIRDRKPTIERRQNLMKKSLSKALARIARDGDIETVAEIIEEMIDPGTAPETETTEAAGSSETAGTAAVESAEGSVVVETPSGTSVAVDESSLEEVLSRLDRIVTLLEAFGPERSGSDAGEGETEEACPREAEDDPLESGIAEAMEEILDPVMSAVLEEETGEPLPETLKTGDAVRAALSAIRPVLAAMPERQRRRVSADMAGRLRRSLDRRPDSDPDIYAALASAGRRTADVSADLGRRIMEKRNANYR